MRLEKRRIKLSLGRAALWIGAPSLAAGAVWMAFDSWKNPSPSAAAFPAPIEELSPPPANVAELPHSSPAPTPSEQQVERPVPTKTVPPAVSPSRVPDSSEPKLAVVPLSSAKSVPAPKNPVAVPARPHRKSNSRLISYRGPGSQFVPTVLAEVGMSGMAAAPTIPNTSPAAGDNSTKFEASWLPPRCGQPTGNGVPVVLKFRLSDADGRNWTATSNCLWMIDGKKMPPGSARGLEWSGILTTGEHVVSVRFTPENGEPEQALDGHLHLSVRLVEKADATLIPAES